jgi:hypothetical protein
LLPKERLYSPGSSFIFRRNSCTHLGASLHPEKQQYSPGGSIKFLRNSCTHLRAVLYSWTWRIRLELCSLWSSFFIHRNAAVFTRERIFIPRNTCTYLESSFAPLYVPWKLLYISKDQLYSVWSQFPFLRNSFLTGQPVFLRNNCIFILEKEFYISLKVQRHDATFLFILYFSTYIHSTTFIQCIHPSPFAEVPSISSSPVSSMGKNSLGCRAEN